MSRIVRSAAPPSSAPPRSSRSPRPTPAFAQDAPAPATQDEEDEQNVVVTATLREQNLLDVPFSINAQTEADIQRSGANTIEDLSRNVAGLADPESRAGPEPGFGARRLRRPDRPRPAGREGAGRRLSRRQRDLAVAVHPRPRPVRPEPRRDAARPAGHPVRLGLGRRHDPLHHQPARHGQLRGLDRRQSQRRRGRRFRRPPEGHGQRAARPKASRSARSAITPNMAASSTRSARRRQRRRERQ